MEYCQVIDATRLPSRSSISVAPGRSPQTRVTMRGLRHSSRHSFHRASSATPMPAPKGGHVHLKSSPRRPLSFPERAVERVSPQRLVASLNLGLHRLLQSAVTSCQIRDGSTSPPRAPPAESHKCEIRIFQETIRTFREAGPYRALRRFPCVTLSPS